MNTIGLLLVLGLAFFAMKQKSEKTRNMLLVVSALLGFCMFSAEGFTVGHNAPGSCAEAGTPTDPDTAACAAVVGTALNTPTACEAVMQGADSAAPACTYTAGQVDAAIPLVAADLPLLFPSCGEGTKVKVGGTLESAMCEDASAGTAAADWGENICGDGAECNATAKFLGGAEVADDKSNKCGSSLYDSWEHVCTCTDDTKTWALATKCTV
jgi:hypothetical protein